MINKDDLLKCVYSILNEDEVYKLIDIISEGYVSTDYFIGYVDSEVLILEYESSKYINWYKLTQIGRCIKSNIKSIDELNTFIKNIVYKVIDEYDV